MGGSAGGTGTGEVAAGGVLETQAEREASAPRLETHPILTRRVQHLLTWPGHPGTVLTEGVTDTPGGLGGKYPAKFPRIVLP